MTVRVLDIDAVLFHDSALIFAGVAQLVEHFLAKEDVASSSLVTRFPFLMPTILRSPDVMGVCRFWPGV